MIREIRLTPRRRLASPLTGRGHAWLVAGMIALYVALHFIQ